MNGIEAYGFAWGLGVFQSLAVLAAWLLRFKAIHAPTSAYSALFYGVFGLSGAAMVASLVLQPVTWLMPWLAFSIVLLIAVCDFGSSRRAAV